MVTTGGRPTRRVALLAPMRPELRAVVRSGALTRTTGDPVFSHAGTAGNWSVVAGVIGMGPSAARTATRRVLDAGRFDHVMVVGIAGGLDPALGVGTLFVPSEVCLGPGGPLYRAHPLPSRTPEGGLMTLDGLVSDEAAWRPILESGFGAVDMEAAAVAEVCDRAGVEWSVYRGISDRPDEHIVDQGLLALTKTDGSAKPSAVVRYLARDPRRVRTLAHLGRTMGRAAAVAADAAFSDLARS
jgi:adenosylhomocysteine nucleosidase